MNLLKYVWKFCALNFQIMLFFDHVYDFLLFRYRLEAIREWNLLIEVPQLKALSMSNPKELKKCKFFPKSPVTLKI